jgi:hypothetical protein
VFYQISDAPVAAFPVTEYSQKYSHRKSQGISQHRLGSPATKTEVSILPNLGRSGRGVRCYGIFTKIFPSKFTKNLTAPTRLSSGRDWGKYSTKSRTLRSRLSLLRNITKNIPIEIHKEFHSTSSRRSQLGVSISTRS